MCTFVIGPVEEMLLRSELVVLFDLDLKAVIDWLTPSAKMNCSLSSMFVRPLTVLYENRKDNILAYFIKANEASSDNIVQ